MSARCGVPSCAEPLSKTCLRKPGHDGPHVFGASDGALPIESAPLSRAEVVRVLSESWKASVVFGRGRKSAAIVNYYSARSDEVRSLASALNLSAAFERAIAKEGGA